MTTRPFVGGVCAVRRLRADAAPRSASRTGAEPGDGQERVADDADAAGGREPDDAVSARRDAAHRGHAAALQLHVPRGHGRAHSAGESPLCVLGSFSTGECLLLHSVLCIWSFCRVCPI